jgi:hypothetical protein
LQETLLDYRCSATSLTAHFSGFVRVQWFVLRHMIRLAPEF